MIKRRQKSIKALKDHAEKTLLQADQLSKKNQSIKGESDKVNRKE